MYVKKKLRGKFDRVNAIGCKWWALYVCMHVQHFSRKKINKKKFGEEDLTCMCNISSPPEKIIQLHFFLQNKNSMWDFQGNLQLGCNRG